MDEPTHVNVFNFVGKVLRELANAKGVKDLTPIIAELEAFAATIP
jgi:hypothetical protein